VATPSDCHPPTRSPSTDYHGAAVAIAGNTVFAGTHEGRVLALDAGDGRAHWSIRTGDRIIAAPCVAGGRVFVGSYDGKVYAIDATTGVVRWTFDTRAPVTSTPKRVGDVVVAGSRSYDLWGLDAATGRARWNRYVWFSWIESSPAVVGRVAYVGSSDAASVFAFDAITGKSHWTRDVHGFAWGTPALDGDRLFLGTRREPGPIAHRSHALALDRATGKVLWRHPIDGANAQGQQGVAGSAAVARSARRVILVTVDGRVLAFDTR
jgi:outer membrane protein assembly factor BamB